MLTFDARRLVDFERSALVCVRVSRRTIAPVWVSICVRVLTLFGQKWGEVLLLLAFILELHCTWLSIYAQRIGQLCDYIIRELIHSAKRRKLQILFSCQLIYKRNH